jgi:hypothetical protein
MPRRLELDPIRAHVAGRYGSGPVRRQDLLGSGLTRSQLRAAVREGVLVPERHGVLRLADAASAVTTHPTDLTHPTVDDVRRRALVALASVDRGAVLSGAAAGILLGLPTLDRRLERITAIRPGGVNYDGPDLRLRGSALPPHRITVIGGIPVTSLERTAVDLARGRRLPQALVVLDAAARTLVERMTGFHGEALRYAVLDPAHRRAAVVELETSLAELYGWPGTVAVRAALTHVRPTSESPAESISRGWFLEAGVGPLETGVPLQLPGRTFWADFCSHERRVVGEVDGWGKYGETAQDFRAALSRERDRQLLIEDDGWRVVRWALDQGRRRVVDRMRHALTAPPRFPSM